MRIPVKQISGIYDTTNTVWGSFYSTQTQTNAGSNTTNTVTFNNTDPDSSGVSVSGSEISVNTTGVYNVQFSAQIDKTDSNDDTIEIWLAKNGNDISATNTQLYISGNNAKYVASWNFVLKLSANEYVQLKWYSADSQMRLYAQGESSNPSRPSIPSVILTVTRCL